MDREKQLEIFVKRVVILRRLPLVAKGQGVGWSLNVSQAKGMSVSVKLLDENDLRSSLLTFRQFIASNEAIQLNKIYSTCFLKLKKNNDLRVRLIEAREVWKQALGKAGNIEFEERIYSTEQAALLWMNGYYFHSDLAQYEHLEKLLSQNWPYIQLHFGNFVVDATKAIIYTGNVVEYARRNNLFEF
jgi:hypothetical protein